MLKLFLSGIAIGIANIIPGVSGGTIAFILGIYDKLTESIGNFFICTKEKRKEYLIFLLPLFAGVGGGILIFAKIIEVLYKNYPQPTSFFFIGLILASLPIVLKQNKGKFDKISILSLILGIAIVIIFLQFKEPTDVNIIRTEFNIAYYMKLFVCGIVGAGAMIIPGISGSMLLLILGEYYNILSYINGIKIMPLVFVGTGIVIGIVLCSKLISYLFEHYRNATIYFILGLILASVLGIWPGFEAKNTLINVIAIILGFITVYASEKLSVKK